MVHEPEGVYIYLYIYLQRLEFYDSLNDWVIDNQRQCIYNQINNTSKARFTIA